MKVRILLVIVAILAAIAFVNFTGCGVPPKKKITVELPAEQPPRTCEGLPVGDTVSENCPAGQTGTRVLFCGTDGTLKLAADTCVAEGNECEDGLPRLGSAQVTFEDVKPILTSKCATCHYAPERFDEYGVAKGLASEMLRRINLAADNPQRMPRTPNPELSKREKDTFEAWVSAGTPERADECGPVGGTDVGHVTLDYIETAQLIDANRIEGSDRPFTRYLLTAHRFNAGATAEEMERDRQALDKTLLGINAIEEDIYRAAPVDPLGVLYRIDLRAYGLGSAEWDLIVGADKLKIESFTNKGVLLKQLLGTPQTFFHHDNFADVTHRNAAVYHALLRIPADFLTLMDQLGVKYVEDLEDFDALALGFNGSRISNGKNRLVTRHESEDGYVYNTYDPVALNGDVTRNLFEFPCPKDLRDCQKKFNHAAGEVIFSLPTGAQGYALYNAAGVRQDKAPIDIVRDTDSPISSEISNGNSCGRCHNSGLIVSQDQVRQHVIDQAAQFDVRDVEIVKQLYRPAPAIAAQFTQDNRRYKLAMEAIGVDVSQPDPISEATDRFLLDWRVEQAAAFLLLTVDELKQCVNESAEARQKIGQLLTGGTVTYDQFVEILPALKRDCRLFQEPLGQ